MLTIEREFIEGAARAMFVSEWADREVNTCVVCGDDRDAGQHVDPHGYMDSDEGEHVFESPSNFGDMDLTDAAPDTPEYAKLEAARLLGKLEAANGYLSLATIMRRAAQAEYRNDCVVDSLGNCMAAHGTKCIHLPEFPNAMLDDEEAREFGHYIAMQALGHGVSWFDDHERFTVPSRGMVRTDSNVPGWTEHKPDIEFRIPDIEFDLE